MHRVAAVVALSLVAACGGKQSAEPVEPAAAEPRGEMKEVSGPVALIADHPEPKVLVEARAGVTDKRLAGLLTRHWDWAMTDRPVWATQIGDHRHDDRIDDMSVAAVERRKAARRAFLDEARAIPEGELSADDRVTRTLFVQELASDVASEVCRFHEWNMTASRDHFLRWNELSEDHVVKNVGDARNLVARYRAIPAFLEAMTVHLRAGAADGMYADAEVLRRTVLLVEKQLALPTADWQMLAPLKEKNDAWTPELRAELTAVVESEVRPAAARYLELLKTELSPKARGGDRPGIVHLPNGKDCYASQIVAFLGEERTADELHQLGLDEIARINGEMRDLGKKLFGTRDLAKILKRLRTRTDPKLYFQTPEEIMAKADSALAGARAAIPKFFGILPATDCVTAVIAAYQAPFTTIAYYSPPHADGSKPGEYYVNTYEPTTRPRFEAEVLAYHESIPGHHLQIAIAMERGALPAFRRHMGLTVFVEGWALYTERLAEEMGLYSADLDRMGMLSYDAWRASRLVVDTGLHAKGWSRARAVKYMMEHTALTPQNIDNEVDRYISWPGQALAYKVGQLEMWRLRRWAETELGEKFDIKGFHDAVLGGGAVSLAVLRAQVTAWVDSRR